MTSMFPLPDARRPARRIRPNTSRPRPPLCGASSAHGVVPPTPDPGDETCTSGAMVPTLVLPSSSSGRAPIPPTPPSVRSGTHRWKFVPTPPKPHEPLPPATSRTTSARRRQEQRFDSIVAAHTQRTLNEQNPTFHSIYSPPALGAPHTWAVVEAVEDMVPDTGKSTALQQSATLLSLYQSRRGSLEMKNTLLHGRTSPTERTGAILYNDEVIAYVSDESNENAAYHFDPTEYYLLRLEPGAVVMYRRRLVKGKYTVTGVKMKPLPEMSGLDRLASNVRLMGSVRSMVSSFKKRLSAAGGIKSRLTTGLTIDRPPSPSTDTLVGGNSVLFSGSVSFGTEGPQTPVMSPLLPSTAASASAPASRVNPATVGIVVSSAYELFLHRCQGHSVETLGCGSGDEDPHDAIPQIQQYIQSEMFSGQVRRTKQHSKAILPKDRDRRSIRLGVRQSSKDKKPNTWFGLR